MPRFYFHLDNHVGVVRDEEGQVLVDLDAARSSAIGSIRSMLKEDLEHGVIDLHGTIEIADEHGATLAVVRYADAVELRHFGSLQ